MAAVTVRLLQKHGKPPISYMGNKQGFADTILDILGLRPGQGADGIVLADVGPAVVVHATLGGAGGSAEEVARWLTVAGQSYRIGSPESGYNQTEAEGHGVTATHGAVRPWMDRVAPDIRIGPQPHAQAVATVIRSWADEEPRALWNRLKAEGWPSLLPTGEGRWLGPQSVEEVARWVWAAAQSFRPGQAESGLYVRTSGALNVDAKTIASSICVAFPPLACWQGKAEGMPLPERLEGWIIYLDPPYENTSGYPHGDCDRATVLALAADYSRRGAVVAISEAAPLAEALGAGWHSVRIDQDRKGAKRTFSRQSLEYLTVNRPPAHVPALQVPLW